MPAETARWLETDLCKCKDKIIRFAEQGIVIMHKNGSCNCGKWRKERNAIDNGKNIRYSQLMKAVSFDAETMKLCKRG